MAGACGVLATFCGHAPVVRLLHSADWQMGRIYAQFEPDDAAALAEARFHMIENLAAAAQGHAVDAVLVAGDVWDAQTVSDKTIRRVFQAMQGFAGPWFLLPGNHDAALVESVWTRARRLDAVPEGVILCLTPEPVLVPGLMAVLPAPLTQRHTYADLTAWFDAAETPPGLPRVGLAHGAVQGVLPEGIDSANPIAPDRAQRARLDYLALGDWHGTRCIDARTWYAGTPETDRFKANDSGQALLVSLAGPGAAPVVEPLATGQFRWQTLEGAVAVASDITELVRNLAACGRQDVVQGRVSGVTDLAGYQALAQAVEQARARTRALVWDAAALSLAPTAADLAGLQADGFVGEVLQMLQAEQAGPEGQRARDALVLLAQWLDPAEAPRGVAEDGV